ncbi:hypothetical protein [Chitinimonas sp.]|uniref:hypothetical protein n=1 Tax=Chitinimonas sp. TaxID=1934313 RepID=UPI0035AEE2DE
MRSTTVFASSVISASLLVCAGPDDRLRIPKPLPRPPLDLRLPPLEKQLEETPASAVSPVLIRSLPLMASSTAPRTLKTDSPEELANEQMLRAIEQRAYAASTNSGACVKRNNDAVGAGVRWSLNNGFGVYWQGKGLRDLQKLVGINEINALCPPGDASPMCRTMPKTICD